MEAVPLGGISQWEHQFSGNLDRPNGQSFFTLDKGDSVTIEGKYKTWVFVHSEKAQHWGWVLRNVLTCEE